MLAAAVEHYWRRKKITEKLRWQVLCDLSNEQIDIPVAEQRTDAGHRGL